MITIHSMKLLGLAAAFVLGASALQAAPAAALPGGGPESSPVGSMLSGELVGASPSSITIKDRQSGSSISVAVTSTTVVTIDGRSGKVADLKAGQAVTVTTEERDGKAVAVTISARSSS